jgi:DNA-binding transcriptional MerR regulator
MKIGELSRKTGLSIHTIRYYEKIGIIRKNGKDKSGHREYADNDIEWIKFITCLKAIEMPLNDILHFICLREKGDKTLPERVKIMKLQRIKLKSKIDDLKKHIKHIDYKISHFGKYLK